MKKRIYLFALFFIALGGLLLHLRIHPFFVAEPLNPGSKVFNYTYFMATILTTLDVILVTLLFSKRQTAVYGYLLNGLIVIYGTILMAHFSINQMMVKQIPFQEMLLKSTLPDIVIAWGDFFVGKALYDSYIKGIITS